MEDLFYATRWMSLEYKNETASYNISLLCKLSILFDCMYWYALQFDKYINIKNQENSKFVNLISQKPNNSI